jgi:hypothetical protein
MDHGLQSSINQAFHRHFNQAHRALQHKFIAKPGGKSATRKWLLVL